MKIQPNAINPLLGANPSNQIMHKKSVVSESITDVANMQERKDSFEQSVPSDKVDNEIYDPNGQLPKYYQGKELNTKNIAPGVDYSKINGIVSELYERKPTEEENKLFNLHMKLYSLSVRQLLSEQTRLEDELDLHGTHLSIDELYAKYDKKFGTNSTDKVNKLNTLWSQYSKVGNMVAALGKALNAGKTRNEAMDFITDNSFNKDEFDYVMNIADNYDYENHKLIDKNVVKNDNNNVSTDLKNSMNGLLKLFGQA